MEFIELIISLVCLSVGVIGFYAEETTKWLAGFNFGMGLAILIALILK